MKKVLTIMAFTGIMGAFHPLQAELDSLWIKLIRPGNKKGYDAMSVVTDPENFHIVTGFGYTLHSSDELWVLKMAPETGDVIWTYTLDNARGHSIKVDHEGNYIVAGFKSDSLLIIKLDRETGSPIWLKTFPDFYSNGSPKLAIDNDGFIVILATKNRPNWELILLKISSGNGDTIWTKILGQTHYIEDCSVDLLVDRDGNYIAITTFTPPIYKIDANNGNIIWTLQFSEDVSVERVITDQQGFYIFVGDTSSSRLWVAKVDPITLNRVWTITHLVRDAYSSYRITPASVVIDKNNYYVIAGYGNDNFQIVPWIIVIAPFRGNIVYEKKVSPDYFYVSSGLKSISLDTSGNYVTAGWARLSEDTSAFLLEKLSSIDREIMWFDTTSSYIAEHSEIFLNSNGNYILPFDSSISRDTILLGIIEIDSSNGNEVSRVSCVCDYFYIRDADTDHNGNIVFLGCNNIRIRNVIKRMNITTGECEQIFESDTIGCYFKRIITLQDGDYLLAGVSINDHGPSMAKIDHVTGNMLWFRSNYAMMDIRKINAITLDHQGNVILGGEFSPPDTSSILRGFVMKFNQTGGQLLWTSVFRRQGHPFEVLDVSVDRDGNYLVSGRTYDSLYVFRIDKNSGNTIWETSLDYDLSSTFFIRDDPNSGEAVAIGHHILAKFDLANGNITYQKIYERGYYGPYRCWGTNEFIVDNMGHYIIRAPSIFTKIYGSSPATGVRERYIEKENDGSLMISRAVLSHNGLNFGLRLRMGQSLELRVYGIDGRKVYGRKFTSNRSGITHFHIPLKTGIYFVEVRSEKGVRIFKGIVLN